MAHHEHERTVTWVPNAAWMFDDAACIISEGSPIAGENFVEDVLRAVRVLELYAEDGRIVPEVGRPDIREIMVGRYRLQYLMKRDTAEILSIAHER